MKREGSNITLYFPHLNPLHPNPIGGLSLPLKAPHPIPRIHSTSTLSQGSVDEEEDGEFPSPPPHFWFIFYPPLILVMVTKKMAHRSTVKQEEQGAQS
ncbi:hypothetical protein GDO86_012272 [Hymenochirus boettgeri]|uniref:Uncharacterized protein n=1 Tax=Hymenochirus boettgeri TaxID=247094 RepID=A0A8T2ISB0_9PIPI|nr:hypothetical protein GDO86_012272 [Hymenochirus boettgeri]